VLVAKVTVTAMSAHAPTGKGSKIRPRMVDVKMASNDHPCKCMGLIELSNTRQVTEQLRQHQTSTGK